MKVVIRKLDSKNDSPYIYATWSKHAFYSQKKPKVKLKDKPKYFAVKRNEIKDHLAHGETRIACLDTDPHLILGYIVANQGEMVWICIKKDFHNQGIEELLYNSIKEYLNGKTKEDGNDGRGSEHEPTGELGLQTSCVEG